MQNNDHLSSPLMNEYLDGVLDSQQAAEVESHLSSCPACAGRLAELRLVFSALENLPEAPLSRDLVAPVLQAIERPIGQHTSGLPALRTAALAQALAALALFLLFWPFVLQSLPPSLFSLWLEQMAAGGTTALQGWLATWAGAWEATWQFLEAGFETWQSPVESFATWEGPFIELVILAGAGALAWLAANGLLLRPRRADHSR